MNENELIDAIARRTTEMILSNLFERHRDEVSTGEICREYGISRETIRRRIRAGIIPQPTRKRGKNWYSRRSIESCDIKGVL